MRFEDLQALLAYGESDWLDYKIKLHPAVESPSGKPPQIREDGRAELLKDLLCLANSYSPRPIRYLVRGVADTTQHRQIVGCESSLSDADLQQWALKKFDPSLEFVYHQWHLDEGYVGVFEIRACSLGAHVPTQNFGQHLIESQVWWRHGSRNTVVDRAALARLFGPPPPSLTLHWQFADGTQSVNASFHRVHDQLADLERNLVQRLNSSILKLQQARTDYRADAAPVNTRGLNNVAPTQPFQIDNTQATDLINTLIHYGLTVSAEDLDVQGVQTDYKMGWPDSHVLGVSSIAGPGVPWFNALKALTDQLRSHPGDVLKTQKVALSFELSVALVNTGRIPVRGGRVILRTRGDLRFQDVNKSAAGKVLQWVRPTPEFTEMTSTFPALPIGASIVVPLAFQRPRWQAAQMHYEVHADEQDFIFSGVLNLT